jgi:E3 ubiquitin-protein ligase HECTD4
LKPGPFNYGEEKMLQFFGQLLGIALRAAIPLPLDLMPSFWRSLIGQPLAAWGPEAAAMDPVTANYLASLEVYEEYCLKKVRKLPFFIIPFLSFGSGC